MIYLCPFGGRKIKIFLKRFIYLRSRDADGEWKRNLPPNGSLPKWLQWPGQNHQPGTSVWCWHHRWQFNLLLWSSGPGKSKIWKGSYSLLNCLQPLLIAFRSKNGLSSFLFCTSSSSFTSTFPPTFWGILIYWFFKTHFNIGLIIFNWWTYTRLRFISHFQTKSTTFSIYNNSPNLLRI